MVFLLRYLDLFSVSLDRYASLQLDGHSNTGTFLATIIHACNCKDIQRTQVTQNTYISIAFPRLCCQSTLGLTLQA